MMFSFAFAVCIIIVNKSPTKGPNWIMYSRIIIRNAFHTWLLGINPNHIPNQRQDALVGMKWMNVRHVRHVCASAGDRTGRNGSGGTQ